MDRLSDVGIIKTERDTFFIGINCADGFKISNSAFFDERNFGKTFILKGSSGGGKSTFIRKSEKLAEKLGAEVTEYRCGSDPFSADGAVIEKGGRKIFITDATPPHSADCAFPACTSEYIDLTKCTDCKKISGFREELIGLSDLKKEAFARAYRYLKAAGELSAISLVTAEKAVLYLKLESAVDRFISKLKTRKGRERVEYTTCFSMRGRYILDTYIGKAEKIYYAKPCFGIENLFFELLRKKLSEKGISHSVSPSPLDTSLCDALYIDLANVLLLNVKTDIPTKEINMKRFLSEGAKKFKGEAKFADRCRLELVSGASDALRDAERYHFEIEKIYIGASDFVYCDRLFEKTVSKYLKSNFQRT